MQDTPLHATEQALLVRDYLRRLAYWRACVRVLPEEEATYARRACREIEAAVLRLLVGPIRDVSENSGEEAPLAAAGW